MCFQETENGEISPAVGPEIGLPCVAFGNTVGSPYLHSSTKHGSKTFGRKMLHCYICAVHVQTFILVIIL